MDWTPIAHWPVNEEVKSNVLAKMSLSHAHGINQSMCLSWREIMHTGANAYFIIVNVLPNELRFPAVSGHGLIFLSVSHCHRAHCIIISAIAEKQLWKADEGLNRARILNIFSITGNCNFRLHYITG